MEETAGPQGASWGLGLSWMDRSWTLSYLLGGGLAKDLRRATAILHRPLVLHRSRRTCQRFPLAAGWVFQFSQDMWDSRPRLSGVLWKS